MLWYKAKWIDPLFAAVTSVFPNRGHAQDGAVGDLEHLTGVSGHNPDDTPGVRAERQDADSRPEVRAADVDTRGVAGDDVVAAVLADPAALRLLIYIIWNRHIWRASNDWRREAYTGDDPHDRHIHFSGHPDADEVAFRWDCIRNMYTMEDEDMGGSTVWDGKIRDTADGFPENINTGRVDAGADDRPAWIAFTNDLGGGWEQYALRVMWTKGDNIYQPLALQGAQNFGDAGSVLSKGKRVWAGLPEECVALSIYRQAIVDGKPVPQSADNPAYPGPLGYSVERGKPEN
ncbi:MAG: hypothetical protein ACJ72N_27460 [Labedaea sp.]